MSAVVAAAAAAAAVVVAEPIGPAANNKIWSDSQKVTRCLSPYWEQLAASALVLA